MIKNNLVEVLQNAPLPRYEGIEPNALELIQIMQALKEATVGDLPRPLRRWVCHRFLPCLTRYGQYPPPGEPSMFKVGAIPNWLS